MSTYQERQAYRDAHPGAIVDNDSSSDGGFHSDTPNGTPSGSGGGGGGGSSGGGGGNNQNQVQNQSASNGLQSLLNALSSGNAAAAAEAIRQFNATFGLDKDKFNESVRQYNQNFGLAEAALTGTYNGQHTLAYQSEQNKTALGALGLAASMHADPFRQMQVMFGMNQNDGINRAIQGFTGQYGANAGVNGSAANTANLGYLGNQINGMGGGQAGAQAQSQSFVAPGTAPPALTASGGSLVAMTPEERAAWQAANPYSGGGTGVAMTNGGGGPGGYTNMEQYDAAIRQMPNPNQVIARNFNTASPGAQNFMLSGISAKTGLDMADVNHQIQKTLPQFNAPSFGLAAV